MKAMTLEEFKKRPFLELLEISFDNAKLFITLETIK